MKRSMMSVALVALLGTAASSAAPFGGSSAEAAAGSYGYVVTMISPAIYKGDDAIDCPEGPAYTIKEEYLAAQSPAERARLMQEENADELESSDAPTSMMSRVGTSVSTRKLSTAAATPGAQ